MGRGISTDVKAKIFQEVKKNQHVVVPAVTLIDGSYKKNLRNTLESLYRMAGMEPRDYSKKFEGKSLSPLEQAAVQSLGLDIEMIMFLVDASLMKDFLLLEWHDCSEDDDLK